MDRKAKEGHRKDTCQRKDSGQERKGWYKERKKGKDREKERRLLRKGRGKYSTGMEESTYETVWRNDR